jgi:hypothetical protein
MAGSLGSKGQIQTVEAITAAIILLSILALVVEATSVTPLTASFTNQHIKLELQNMGMDALATLDETPVSITNGSVPSMLKESVVQWATTYQYDWYTWTGTKYVSLTDAKNRSNLHTPLGDTFSYLLKYYGIAYNVEVRYTDRNGQILNAKMIWNGNPSENSVTVSRIVTLNDNDNLPDDGLIPDISSPTSQYNSVLWNVVEVRVTMWVM